MIDNEIKVGCTEAMVFVEAQPGGLMDPMVWANNTAAVMQESVRQGHYVPHLVHFLCTKDGASSLGTAVIKRGPVPLPLEDLKTVYTELAAHLVTLNAEAMVVGRQVQHEGEPHLELLCCTDLVNGVEKLLQEL